MLKLADMNKASRVGIFVLVLMVSMFVYMYVIPRRAVPVLRARAPEEWSVLTAWSVAHVAGLPVGMDRMIAKSELVAIDPRVSPPTGIFIAQTSDTPVLVTDFFLATYSADLKNKLAMVVESSLPVIEGVRVARFLARGSTTRRVVLSYIFPLGHGRAVLTFGCNPEDLDRYLPSFEAAVAATLRASR